MSLNNNGKYRCMNDMHAKSKLKWITLIALMITVAIFSIFKFSQKRNQLLALTEPLVKGSALESVYGIGTVTANRSFQLKPGVTTSVLKLYVKEGDQVKKGARLVDLSDMNPVHSPFDGTITFLPAKVGETVFAQSVVLSVVDLTDRYIIVSLEQRAALRVVQNQKAKINFDSMRNQSFDGIVQAIYSNDNNFFVRIGADNLPPQILPGMTGDVAISIAEHKDVLLVPVAAIESGKVYVDLGHGRSKQVNIKIGVVDATMAELIEGDLREGDRLQIRKKISK